jgi:SAM-dependent methyltransferase
MSAKNDFYQRVHDGRPDYSGSTYDLKELMSTRPFEQWLGRQAGRAGNVLDVGCGKGFFLRDFRIEGERRQLSVGRSVGFDLIRSSGCVFSESPEKFEFVQGSVDGEPLPFADASFDLIACNHVLECVFRRRPDTHSYLSRTPVPILAGHRFRSVRTPIPVISDTLKGRGGDAG